MKKEIPSEVVDVCDICKSQKTYLEKCIVCGKEYCNICEAVMSGCMHQPDICKDCGKDEHVKFVVHKYAKNIFDIVNYRTQELINLVKNENAKNKTE